jgi:hypothetical protein
LVIEVYIILPRIRTSIQNPVSTFGLCREATWKREPFNASGYIRRGRKFAAAVLRSILLLSLKTSSGSCCGTVVAWLTMHVVDTPSIQHCDAMKLTSNQIGTGAQTMRKRRICTVFAIVRLLKPTNRPVCRNTISEPFEPHSSPDATQP